MCFLHNKCVCQVSVQQDMNFSVTFKCMSFFQQIFPLNYFSLHSRRSIDILSVLWTNRPGIVEALNLLAQTDMYESCKYYSPYQMLKETDIPVIFTSAISPLQSASAMNPEMKKWHTNFSEIVIWRTVQFSGG